MKTQPSLDRRVWRNWAGTATATPARWSRPQNAAEISAAVVEDDATFRALRGPVQRICAAAVPVPYSPPLEDFVLPNKDRIAAAARAALER